MEPFLGQVQIFGFNFAPRGWAFCQGQLLPIAQNTALFALLGTLYGGDGRTTFALPDLRGRVPIGFGQGPGLSNYPLAARGGVEQVTLIASEIPAHSHTLQASTEPGTGGVPTDAYLASTGARDPEYVSTAPNTSLGSQSIGAAGGGQAHENRMPYLAMNYCIALVGIFPSRS